MGIIDKYPASKLPDDLRGDIPEDALVRVTVQELDGTQREEKIGRLQMALKDARAEASKNGLTEEKLELLLSEAKAEKRRKNVPR